MVNFVLCFIAIKKIVCRKKERALKAIYRVAWYVAGTGKIKPAHKILFQSPSICSVCFPTVNVPSSTSALYLFPPVNPPNFGLGPFIHDATPIHWVSFLPCFSSVTHHVNCQQPKCLPVQLQLQACWEMAVFHFFFVVVVHFSPSTPLIP